ncbi:uncharacterized protein LACBIDRAFT_336178 [Laccaria bicolor S238N-H82]|uniref:Predicted protein n=1 Tax=Laccaria bicolor (strain S238N-H82 / ATCC MYA-4686) TaxID=486041 RepID=B0E4M7_LACBS|nr:uncharacterized protein LACBIDRAFT_336178 [Laccaria bicolor S238N-H82]EDQ98204.1 predicted protein [Laccaria bicolor S238N-H82]|eukprot:XP_001891146.1 predicted protein [Laccaria bicolor S238N-H82]
MLLLQFFLLWLLGLLCYTSMPSVFSSKTWNMLRSGNTGVNSELCHFWPCTLLIFLHSRSTNSLFSGYSEPRRKHIIGLNPMDFYAISSLNYDLLHWDQGSFGNYLDSSEVDYNPNPWAPSIVIDLNLSPLAANHLVEPLPFNMARPFGTLYSSIYG